VHAIGAVFELASTLGRTRWVQNNEARRMVVIAQQFQLRFQWHERRAQCTGAMKALSKKKGRGTTRSAHEMLIYAPPRRPTAPGPRNSVRSITRTRHSTHPGNSYP